MPQPTASNVPSVDAAASLLAHSNSTANAFLGPRRPPRLAFGNSTTQTSTRPPPPAAVQYNPSQGPAKERQQSLSSQFPETAAIQPGLSQYSQTSDSSLPSPAPTDGQSPSVSCRNACSPPNGHDARSPRTDSIGDVPAQQLPTPVLAMANLDSAAGASTAQLPPATSSPQNTLRQLDGHEEGTSSTAQGDDQGSGPNNQDTVNGSRENATAGSGLTSQTDPSTDLPAATEAGLSRFAVVTSNNDPAPLSQPAASNPVGQAASTPPFRYAPLVSALEAQAKELSKPTKEKGDELTENARILLLKEACNAEDSFFVALHQLFCLWSLEPKTVHDSLQTLGPGRIDKCFGDVQLIFRSNRLIRPSLLHWFSVFPLPFSQMASVYRECMPQVAAFMVQLATSWSSLMAAVTARSYPLLLDELVGMLHCHSPTLQMVLFTASRRRLNMMGEKYISKMDDIFRTDQAKHRKEDGRFFGPPSDQLKELEPRNKTTIEMYRHIVALAKPRAKQQAGAPANGNTQAVPQAQGQTLPSQGLPPRVPPASSPAIGLPSPLATPSVHAPQRQLHSRNSSASSAHLPSALPASPRPAQYPPVSQAQQQMQPRQPAQQITDPQQMQQRQQVQQMSHPQGMQQQQHQQQQQQQMQQQMQQQQILQQPMNQQQQAQQQQMHQQPMQQQQILQQPMNQQQQVQQQQMHQQPMQQQVQQQQILQQPMNRQQQAQQLQYMQHLQQQQYQQQMMQHLPPQQQPQQPRTQREQVQQHRMQQQQFLLQQQYRQSQLQQQQQQQQQQQLSPQQQSTASFTVPSSQGTTMTTFPMATTTMNMAQRATSRPQQWQQMQQLASPVAQAPILGSTFPTLPSSGPASPVVNGGQVQELHAQLEQQAAQMRETEQRLQLAQLEMFQQQQQGQLQQAGPLPHNQQQFVPAAAQQFGANRLQQATAVQPQLQLQTATRAQQADFQQQGVQWNLQQTRQLHPGGRPSFSVLASRVDPLRTRGQPSTGVLKLTPMHATTAPQNATRNYVQQFESSPSHPSSTRQWTQQSPVQLAQTVASNSAQLTATYGNSGSFPQHVPQMPTVAPTPRPAQLVGQKHARVTDEPWPTSSIFPAPGARIYRSEQPHDPADRRAVAMSLHLTPLRSPQRQVVDAKPKEALQPNAALEAYYQSIQRMALGPVTVAPQTHIYTFEFTVTEGEFKRLPVDSIFDGAPMPVERHSNGSLRYRFRCCAAEEGRELTEAEWVIRNTTWPDSIFINFNDEPVSIRSRVHNGKDLPAELTHRVRVGTNTLQVVIPHVGPAKTKKQYALGVEIIETVSHSHLLRRIERNGLQPSTITAKKIMDRLARTASNDEDVVLAEEELSVDLADVFIPKIFVIPVRGVQCQHIECFDLFNWLNSRPRPPPVCHHQAECMCADPDKLKIQPTLPDKWRCPICLGDARPCSLIIDGFLIGVRTKLEKAGLLDRTKSIRVSKDGTWRPVTDEPDADDDIDDDDNDDEKTAAEPRRKIARPDPEATAATASRRSSRPIEVIDLDD